MLREINAPNVTEIFQYISLKQAVLEIEVNISSASFFSYLIYNINKNLDSFNTSRVYNLINNISSNYNKLF